MRYLIRGGMSPLDNFSVNEILAGNMIGDNSGNVLYLLGIYSTLFREGQDTVEVDYYQAELNGFSEEDMERINSEYDAYILPLADAFREDYFRSRLPKYEDFFSKLKIPLVIPGVGLRAGYEPDFSAGFPFDEEVTCFMKAALEHTACVGLRGELTAKYLETLGFREDRDFKVIGCPSMYTFGRELPWRPLDTGNLDTARLAVNFHGAMPHASMKFLMGLGKKNPNVQYIGQTLNDARLICYGIPYGEERAAELRPTDMDHPLMRGDRFRFFVNPMDWLDFMGGCALSVGGRFHGSVAAVLAGCPALFLPADARTRELAEYHHLPGICAHKVKADTDLRALAGSVDLGSHRKAQAKNLENYLSFLHAQGIPSVYDEGADGPDASLMEKLRARPATPVENVLSLTPKQVAEREADYFTRLADIQRENSARLRQQLQKENRRLKKRLDSKAVRLARKLQQAFWSVRDAVRPDKAKSGDEESQ